MGIHWAKTRSALAAKPISGRDARGQERTSTRKSIRGEKECGVSNHIAPADVPEEDPESPQEADESARCMVNLTFYLSIWEDPVCTMMNMTAYH